MEKQVKKPTGVLEANMVQVLPVQPLSVSDLLLRAAVVALTAAAAVVMGTARQTSIVPVQISPTLPPLPVAVLAKSTYSSAFTYFVAANTVASAYTMLSILLSVASRDASTRKRLSLLLTVADVVMVALLYSGGGAAAAIGVVGEKGNSHIGWNRICGVFARLCAFVMASVVMSLAASVLQVALVAMAVLNLHRNSL